MLDEEEDKEKSSPTTPAPQRPTRRPVLLRSHPFGTKQENVPNYVHRKLFH